MKTPTTRIGNDAISNMTCKVCRPPTYSKVIGMAVCVDNRNDRSLAKMLVGEL